jgi:antitoxin component YwqK of YwqJK toxin-antitoxin module
VHYFKNGKINYVQEYENGQMNGEFSVFSAGGFLLQHGQLKDGKNAAVWLNYNAQGLLQSKQIYDSVKNIYREIRFDDKNNIISDRSIAY